MKLFLPYYGLDNWQCLWYIANTFPQAKRASENLQLGFGSRRTHSRAATSGAFFSPPKRRDWSQTDIGSRTFAIAVKWAELIWLFFKKWVRLRIYKLSFWLVQNPVPFVIPHLMRNLYRWNLDPDFHRDDNEATAFQLQMHLLVSTDGDNLDIFIVRA